MHACAVLVCVYVVLLDLRVASDIHVYTHTYAMLYIYFGCISAPGMERVRVGLCYSKSYTLTDNEK